MKIIIIDDKSYKINDLLIILNHLNVKIDVINYFDKGLSALKKNEYDYAILDDNILRDIDYREIVNNAAEQIVAALKLFAIKTKCIILSSNEIKLEGYDNLIGIIKYSSISTDWVKTLIKLIK